MELAYPLPFLRAFLDTAESADLTSNAAKTGLSKLRHIIASPPSVVYNRALKELVPRLAWEIDNEGGSFHCPSGFF
jgi:hypothetical protein